MLLLSHPGGIAVARRAETHKPGKVTKIVNSVEVREELAEITLAGTDPGVDVVVGGLG